MLLKNFWTTLKRYKVASLLNIIGLSVAFAAFAIIMMQVRYDLTYDKFHTHYDEIFEVQTKWLNEDGSEQKGFSNFFSGVSLPIARQLETFSPDIVAMAKMHSGTRTQAFKTREDQEDYPFTETLMPATPGILDIFDFPIVAGDTAGFHLPNTALIPESVAQRMFPDEPAVGKAIYSSGRDSQPRKIIGVYRDFPVNSYLKNRIFVRQEPSEGDDQIGSINGTVFIRLSSADKKEDVEQNIVEQIERVFGEETNSLYRIVSLHDLHYGGDPSSAERIDTARTYLFLGIGILIVVIAMINFINFSTSLVPARLKSVNTRKVLGQSDASIRFGMIFEAMALCVISVCFSIWIVYFLSTTSFTGLMAADMDLGVNRWVMLGTVGIALATGLLAGIYPAFYITSFSPALVLKGSFGLSPKGRKLRTFLISFQYTVSFVLIVVAIFMHVQHTYMRKHPMGYNRENVLTFNLNSNLRSKLDVVHEKLLQNPDIRYVGFMNGELFGTGGSRQGSQLNNQEMFFDVKRVSPGFLDVFGIELIEGRDFQESDRQKKYDTYIVNETAAKQYGLKAGDILINTDEWYDDKEDRPQFEVAGIIRNFNYKPLRQEIDPMALIFTTHPDIPLSNVYLKVASDNYPATMQAIRTAIGELDSAYTEFDIKFFDETIGRYYEKESKLATLITLFSGLAIVISLIGVFGLILFETQYRRKEIGIRRINGATVNEVLQLLNRNYVKIVVICFAIAVPIAYYFITKWLEEFAYKSAIHFWIFIVALAAILLITALTVTLQSYRAATENPVNAIKTE